MSNRLLHPNIRAEHSTLQSKMHNPDPTSPHDEQLWYVQSEEAGQRLDRYVVSILSGNSRAAAQQLIANGTVLVNGHASKSGYALRAGDEVQLCRPVQKSQAEGVQPQFLPLDIIYEDDDLLVVNKAAGVVVHPAPGHHDDTLLNALLARYPYLQEIEDDLRPGIVHRLDKDTSGLLLVAKNARVQAALAEQMQRHEVIKRYLVLVEGIVSLDQGSIDAPIGRDPRHRQQMTIMATRSRDARTHFRVLQRFVRHTLLLLQLETGRTHQIRVHLQAIGHPVAGDPVYGSGNFRRDMPLKRQFLHAYQLRFVHPSTGATLELEAPLPPDLQAVLHRETSL